MKKLFIILSTVFTVFTFLISTILAYDNRVAHPDLSAAAVGVYNASADRKITDEEKSWVIKGSIDELIVTQKT